MTNFKNTRRALLGSVISLLLCFSMLLGTTFAWFTDSVTSADNIIQSGKLDIGMYWAEGGDSVPTLDSDWTDASSGAIFNSTVWEPGYVEAKHIKIANEGTLALKYKLLIVPNGVVSELADVIDVYFIDGARQISRDDLSTLSPVGTLRDLINETDGAAHGALLTADETPTSAYEKAGELTATIAFKMREEAGNYYQEMSIGSSFALQLLATQYTYEGDSFDTLYDKEAAYPTISSISVPSGTTEDVAFTVGNTTVWIPAGESGVYEITVTNESISTDPATDKTTVSFDLSLTKDGVKVSGATDYTVEMNIGKNLIFDKVTHNGETVDGAAYDPFSGIVTFTVNSFSPFTVSYSRVGDEAPVLLPEGVNAESFGENVAYVNGVYYPSLKDAMIAVHNEKADAAEVYLKPGANLGTVTHAHVCTNVTVYGNGAYISDGEHDFEIGMPQSTGISCAGIGGDITLNVYNLSGASVWGSINAAHQYDVTVNLFNCKDMSKVMLLKSGSAPAYNLEINIDNCSFSATDIYKDSAIYCQNLGSLTVSNTTFEGYAVGINQNNKDGVESYTFVGCTFIDCATAANVTTQTSYAAPIRAVASAAGTVTNLTVTDCEFVYSNPEDVAINGDLLTYQSGNAGTVNVTLDGVAQ